MRGRTNLPSGITLNATTSTMKVAEESGIVAGDFVEYKNVAPYTTTGNYSFKHILPFDDDNKMFVVVDSSGYIKMAKVETNQITILDTYTTYIAQTDKRNIITKDKKIYFFDYTNKYIRRLEFIDGTLQLTKSKLVTFTKSYSYNSAYSFCFVGDLLTFWRYEASDSTNPYYFSTLDIDTWKMETSTYYKDENKNCALSRWITCVDEKLYYFKKSDIGYRQLTFYHTSDGKLDTAIIPVTVSSSNGIFEVGLQIPIIDGKFFVGSNGYLYTFDYETKTSTYINSSYSGSLVSEIDETKYIGFNARFTSPYYQTFSIFEYNKRLNTVELVSENKIEVQAYEDNTEVLVMGNTIIYGIANLLVLITLDSSHRNITAMETYTSVSKWKGSSNIIGVAKNSGSNGNYINVYVPSSTY